MPWNLRAYVSLRQMGPSTSSFGITKSLKWLLKAALSRQKETDACNLSTQEDRRI